MAARKEVFAPYRRKHCLVFLFQAFMTFKLLSVKEDEVESADRKTLGSLGDPWSFVHSCIPECEKISGGHLGFWKRWADIIEHSFCSSGSFRVPSLMNRIFGGTVWNDLQSSSRRWSWGTTYSFTAESPLTGFRELCYSPCLRCQVKPFERVQRDLTPSFPTWASSLCRQGIFYQQLSLTPDSFVQRQRLTQRL